MKKLFSLVSLLCIYSLSLAQIPAYYSGIDFTQSGENLKNQLTTLITNTHTTKLYYTSGASNNYALDTWSVIKESDLDPEDNTHTNVLLTYGYDPDVTSKYARERDKSLSCHSNSCNGYWTREHTFAKSLATPSLTTDDPGSGTDAHNLRAIDQQYNASRGNRKFIDGSGNSGNTNSGFYPGDEWKGSVARIIMYMTVRYPSQCDANNTAISTNTYSSTMPDIFLQWNAEEAPSAFEIQRNNTIYSYQGNRNPFIDNPYLATMIWGGPQATDSWNVLKTEDIFTPESDCLIYPSFTSESYVNIKAKNVKSIYIYNMNGQMVGVDKNLNDDTIPIPESAGIYLIKVQLENGLKTMKIIKNR